MRPYGRGYSFRLQMHRDHNIENAGVPPMPGCLIKGLIVNHPVPRRNVGGLLIGLVMLAYVFPGLAWAQKEVTSRLYRYRQQEVITRYSEEHEVKPRAHLPIMDVPISRRDLLSRSPTAEKVRHRSYMADSHWGLRFYQHRSCKSCHPRQARNLHKVRNKITCRQCHGEEPIAGVKHYYSPLHPIRQYATVCAKCHQGSSASFAAYMVHEPSPADRRTRTAFPLLFYAFWGMVALAGGTFAALLPHTLLWGLRELRSKKPSPTVKAIQIRRFTTAQRLFHLILVLTFITQAATGLARLYGGTPWGSYLASFFGGHAMTLKIHWWAGLMMLAAFGCHIIYILNKINWRRLPASVYGPDSLLPRWQDGRQAFQHLLWIVGKGPLPHFDRWTYWEKFDYWAVFWGICLLGTTGIVLYFPVFFSRYLPGWIINVLLWVHRIEAILAMVHVFTIHFFIGHLRRDNFPMDLTMFEGSTELKKLDHERPDWMERMQLKGSLQNARVAGAPPALRALYYAFGFTVIGGCTYLLIAGIIHAKELKWLFGL